MTDIEKVIELLRLGAEPSFDNGRCYKVACEKCTFHDTANIKCILGSITIKDIKQLLPTVKLTYPELFI